MVRGSEDPLLRAISSANCVTLGIIYSNDVGLSFLHLERRPIRSSLPSLSAISNSHSKRSVAVAHFFTDVIFNIVHKVAEHLFYRSASRVKQRMGKNSKKLVLIHIFQSIKIFTISVKFYFSVYYSSKYLASNVPTGHEKRKVLQN